MKYLISILFTIGCIGRSTKNLDDKSVPKEEEISSFSNTFSLAFTKDESLNDPEKVKELYLPTDEGCIIKEIKPEKENILTPNLELSELNTNIDNKFITKKEEINSSSNTFSLVFIENESLNDSEKVKELYKYIYEKLSIFIKEEESQENIEPQESIKTLKKSEKLQYKMSIKKVDDVEIKRKGNILKAIIPRKTKFANIIKNGIENIPGIKKYIKSFKELEELEELKGLGYKIFIMQVDYIDKLEVEKKNVSKFIIPNKKLGSIYSIDIMLGTFIDDIISTL